MAMDQSLGFLGAGRMATALATGFLKAGLFRPDQILAGDPAKDARETFARQTGARAVIRNAEVAATADLLVLAVKPDQVQTALAEIRESFGPAKLLISIAAGVTLSKLESSLGTAARVVRVMPNTPALVGASATAYALGQAARFEDGALVQTLFSAVGMAMQVKESLLNAVTGLSGSGPAFAFVIMEALSDGGVAAGLPRDVATRLAAQTMLGSAKLLLETGLHAGALKDMVASPGGTTIEGLHQLERAGLRGALINAVRASADKAAALGDSIR